MEGEQTVRKLQNTCNYIQDMVSNWNITLENSEELSNVCKTLAKNIGEA